MTDHQTTPRLNDSCHIYFSKPSARHRKLWLTASSPTTNCREPASASLAATLRFKPSTQYELTSAAGSRAGFGDRRIALERAGWRRWRQRCVRFAQLEDGSVLGLLIQHTVGSAQVRIRFLGTATEGGTSIYLTWQ